MKRHVIAPAREFPPETRRIVEIEGRSIGVFNIQGAYFALRNRCPHQGAPLCRGLILDRVAAERPYALSLEDGQEIVKCPWHGWEFDVRTGRSVFNPHRVRVRAYEVTVESPAEAADDPAVDTFEVTVEDGLVILHA
jgi:3-phenylpropionate/trans-cinnamate dioxygenase ferredoxin subunit